MIFNYKNNNLENEKQLLKTIIHSSDYNLLKLVKLEKQLKYLNKKNKSINL